MADINLLQASEIDDSSGDRYYKLGNVAGYVILALAIIFSVYLYIRLQGIEKDTASAYADQQNVASQIQHSSGYATLISDQAKIIKLKTLLNNHLLWSKVLPDFFAATLQGATYKGFTANKDGTVTVTGEVNNFQDLDKLIKGMQLEDFQQYIKDVQLLNVGLASEGKTKITYTLNVTFNKDILANK